MEYEEATNAFSLDVLLMHYASHHHVLEKLMMYESEVYAVNYRYRQDLAR